jgi:hypothetical protein
MYGSCFVVTAQIDCTCYTNTLSNTDYNSYTIIDSKFVCKNNLEYISVSSYSISRFKGNPETIEAIIYFFLDISSNYQQIV